MHNKTYKAFNMDDNKIIIKLIKTVLHRYVDATDLYRPTYAHMPCYTRDGTAGSCTLDVILVSKKELQKWYTLRSSCNGELALHFRLLLFTLLVLLASFLASAKPAWLNFGQHRGPTYFYNNGSKNGRKLMGAFYHINCKQ